MLSRRLLVALILLGAGDLSSLAFARPGAILGVAPGAGAGFNILLVTLDTTRADRLGCYGRTGAATPVLDRLAAGGVRFAEAVTVAPETLPAHATLLTGLLPPRHGVRINGESRLESRHTSLAEVARARGYETAAFVSAFVLDARFGLDQGFDLYDDRVDAAEGAVFPSGMNERPAGRTTDAALAWLRARDRRKPFLAWVHYFDAHAPYAPPEPFAGRFAGSPYDGEIAYMDAQIGRLLEGLEAAGQRDRTLVIVVGDHGESLGDHGERTHSLFLYRSATRVPLIVSNPRLFPRPAVVDGTVVSLADVAPTVLDLLGVEDPPARDGLSLLATKADPNRSAYVESLVPYLDFGWAPLFGLRGLRHSYILAPRAECYDLRSDPGEQRNRLDPKTGKRGACAAQARQLERMLARLPSYEGVAAAAPSVDPETRERLQALGYLGGPGPGGAHGPLADPKDMIDIASLVVDANALLAGGRPAEALEVAQRAAARSRHDRTVLNTLAKIYLRLGRLKDAEDALRALRAIQPRADASVLLAQILILDGRHEEAGKLLDEAEGQDPRHGGVHIARGDLLARQGRKEDARASYERAREVDPYRAAGAAAARLARLHGGPPSR
jgi:arylsulfatase A-like enzyme/Flp pilus assembly protein TadD